MFIYTAKLEKSKLILIGLLLAALLALVVLVAANSSVHDEDGSPVMETAIQNTAAETNEDRITFLASYGWVVDQTPVETQEVKIPSDFPEVLEKYNELQMSQGFDLHKYEGKRIKRYVYTVTNYPDTNETVLATLLVYKDKVIGGDISTASQDGFLHGFENPN